MATEANDPTKIQWSNPEPTPTPDRKPAAGDAPGHAGGAILDREHLLRVLRGETEHHGVSHNGKPGGK